MGQGEGEALDGLMDQKPSSANAGRTDAEYGPFVTDSIRRSPATLTPADRTYFDFDRWEPFEDLLPLLADRPSGQLPTDVLQSHDALFALAGQ